MPRVEFVDPTTAAPIVQPYIAAGHPASIVAALAIVPELLGPTLDFVGVAFRAGAASTRHKQLAILRTSVLQGCRYGVDAHTVAALDAGLTVDEVRALRGESPIEAGFPDHRERVVIGWIDAMAGATGPVLDDVYAAVREHWPADDLIDLSVTIGAAMFLSRFATGFDLPTSAEVTARLGALGLA